VVDGASPDGTAAVVEALAAAYPALRYVREPANSGIDADYDKAVGYARGDFCWLMTDDDLLVPGAVARVLEEVAKDVDLVVVNSEVRDARLREVLQGPRFKSVVDLHFGIGDGERLFTELADYLSFIGGVVVRRQSWIERRRKEYYGTAFVHVGVIFQAPPLERAVVVAQPLVIVRFGNALWSPRSFAIWCFAWPQLVWSFAHFSEVSRRAVCELEPWRRIDTLMLHRACGSYSKNEYRAMLRARARGLRKLLAWSIAVLPASLANLGCTIYLGLFRRKARVARYDLLRSRHAGPATRLAARALRLA